MPVRLLIWLAGCGLLGAQAPPSPTQCPNPVSQWAYTLVGPSEAGRVYEVAVAPDGNVFFVGTFSGTLDFDPGEGSDIRSAAKGAFFITMLRADDSYGWTRAFGVSEPVYPNGLAVHPKGDVLLTGAFSGIQDFDPGEGVDQRTASGRYTVFLVRLSRDGDYLGTLTFGTGTIYGVGGSAVTADSAGNVYVAGSFSGEAADFDPTSGVDDHTGTSFVTRFNADGSYAWTRTWGNWLFGWAGAVGVDPCGNVFVHGEFRGTVDFDPGESEDLHTALVPGAPYVTRFNSDGSYAWTRTLDTVRYTSPYDGLVVDRDGNVLITDGFTGTRDFDPTPGVEDWHMSDGPGSAYVTKLSGDGAYLWTHQIGGYNGSAWGNGVAPNPNGGTALTGLFPGTVDFDPGDGTDERTSLTVYEDVFVTLLRADGSYSWTRTFGGSSHDFGYMLTVDADGSIVVGGSYRLTADFDPGCAEDIHDNFTGAGLGYVVKLGCVPPTADGNADGVVDFVDFAALQNCFSGSAPTICNPGCYHFDFDGDDDIDLLDFAEFQALFRAP